MFIAAQKKSSPRKSEKRLTELKQLQEQGMALADEFLKRATDADL